MVELVDDGEVLACESCGDSFNATETGCESHCLRCAGAAPGCRACKVA